MCSWFIPTLQGCWLLSWHCWWPNLVGDGHQRVTNSGKQVTIISDKGLWTQQQVILREVMSLLSPDRRGKLFKNIVLTSETKRQESPHPERERRGFTGNKLLWRFLVLNVLTNLFWKLETYKKDVLAAILHLYFTKLIIYTKLEL